MEIHARHGLEEVEYLHDGTWTQFSGDKSGWLFGSETTQSDSFAAIHCHSFEDATKLVVDFGAQDAFLDRLDLDSEILRLLAGATGDGGVGLVGRAGKDSAASCPKISCMQYL